MKTNNSSFFAIWLFLIYQRFKDISRCPSWYLVIDSFLNGLLQTCRRVYTYHLLKSKLSHSAVSSLYSARLRRNLANSCCNSVWRSRDTLALTTVAANARTRSNHASDNPAAPIIQVIASATPRYRAVRIASASLCKRYLIWCIHAHIIYMY